MQEFIFCVLLFSGESEDGSPWDLVTDVPWLQYLYSVDKPTTFRFPVSDAEYKRT